jgi:hypothetical protein
MDRLAKETRRIPKLVNLENFILPEIPTTTNIKKWNLNKILLILFVLFMIFFLYNCKYGMFQSMENIPEPYILNSSNL